MRNLQCYGSFDCSISSVWPGLKSSGSFNVTLRSRGRFLFELKDKVCVLDLPWEIFVTLHLVVHVEKRRSNPSPSARLSIADCILPFALQRPRTTWTFSGSSLHTSCQTLGSLLSFAVCSAAVRCAFVWAFKVAKQSQKLLFYFWIIITKQIKLWMKITQIFSF